MSVQSDALDVLFLDESLSLAAVFRPRASSAGEPVRVMRRAPDDDVSFADSRFLMETVILQVRVSEVAKVRPGDTFEIAGELFEVRGDPRRDSERLLWICEAREA